MSRLFAAIDVGASSGRVIAGQIAKGQLSLREVHRFSNAPVESSEGLVWNFDELMSQVRLGIRELGAYAERLGQNVESVGIDTWAVDYGLVAGGELIAPPSCYREPLNSVGVARVHERVQSDELYSITGLQFLPFNSLYQIARQQERQPQYLEAADQLLLLPDLIGYLLTGVAKTERTNASSTGLLDAKTRSWSKSLLSRLEIRPGLLAELADAGSTLGPLLGGFGPRLKGTQVVLVGSHDTASAVVGTPAEATNFAFLSSGTWSLLGAEIAEPILTPESRAANFTNELGVDGRVRYLKNLSGLWLLSESLRYWQEQGQPQELRQLLIEAALTEPSGNIDVADERFLAPGPMPELIAKQLLESGQTVPATPTEFTATILHSLAQSYSTNLLALSELTGLRFDKLHVIGGGAQNELLCQLTADYCEISVVAGPVEATAIGNLLIQARAAGLVGPTLEDARELLQASDFALFNYLPRN
jgi:rhamnulokinase